MRQNISLRIKRIFLNFLQGYFTNHSKYTWTADVRTSKIFIADKYAVETGKPPIKPTVVLTRGPIQWAQITRGEPMHNLTTFNRGTAGLMPTDTSVYTDLLNSTIQLQILAKDPSEADFIATEIFTLISATKHLLYTEGIHKISNIALSDEQPMFQGATFTWTRVTVTLGVMWEQTVGQAEELHALKVTVSSGDSLIEGLHYTVVENGTQVKLFHPLPADQTLTIDYISALTLEEKFKKNLLLVPGQNILYVVPELDVIYGHYKLLEHIRITEQTTNTETRV